MEGWAWRPCLVELVADLALPSEERGPVDFWALRRLAKRCCMGETHFRIGMEVRPRLKGVAREGEGGAGGWGVSD